MSKAETKKRSRSRTPNNRTTTGFRISDELWAVLEPLLPVHVNTHRFGGGRPRVPDRPCADAIFFVLRTGCQWRALDQTELCAHSTAHNRFQVWVEAGVFLQLWQAGVKRFDERCGIEWDWLAMDGAITKAPLGGEKTGPNPTDRGKSGVKRSLLTEGHGVPISLVAEGANRHDMKLVRATVESLVVERPEPTEERPQGMCLDAGYDYNEVYELLQEFGKTRACAPAWGRGKGNQTHCRLQSAPVGGRAGTCLDEPFSPLAHPLGEETRKLSGVSPFRLWLDCVSGGRGIRISS